MTNARRPVLFGSHEGRQGRFILGTLRLRADGSGTLRPLAGPPELFVPRDEAAKALDGDLVRAEVIPTQARGKTRGPDPFHGRQSARVVEVVEQRRRHLIGTLDKRGGEAFVVPRDRRSGAPVPVHKVGRYGHGDLVKVRFAEGGAHGSVVEKLDGSQARTVMLEAAYAQGFSDIFPAAVLRAVDALTETIADAERARRLDLTGLDLVTIDGEDARDFDDAVFAEPLDGGRFRLVVAIADVAHFVPRGSSVDLEALRRATSVYFPALVLPMLPPRLSNDLCSLNPGVERLSLVADMVFAPRGESLVLQSATFHEAIIKSAARCTYRDIDAFLDGGRVAYLEPLRERIDAMACLARRLIRTRELKGAIDLDLPEMAVVADASGEPTAIAPRARTLANRLVEEFMLAANEAVALHFESRDLPTIFRVHADPNTKKLAECLRIAHAHGVGLQFARVKDSWRGEDCRRVLNALVKAIDGHPAARSLSFQILRSMAQAFYSADNAGHFGLASDAYLHFTSPIRRYPDLEVHRLLKESLGAGKKRRQSRDKVEERLDAIAGRSSERERAALAAERDVQAWAAARLMRDRVGERFTGAVSAVTDFGVFVRLDEVNIEGLLKPERLGRSRVELDPGEQRARLGSKQSLQLGHRLVVEVERVDEALRHIDLRLVRLGA